MQLYAAALPEAVLRMLDSLDVQGFDARRAAEMLSVFDVELLVEQDVPSPSWCAVLDNILSRGKPTITSSFIEDVLIRRLGLTQKIRPPA